MGYNNSLSNIALTLSRLLAFTLSVAYFPAMCAHLNLTRFTDHNHRNNNVQRSHINYTLLHSSWTKQTFPNPWTQPSRCGRTHRSFICDPSRVLSYEDGSRLDKMLDDICREPNCNCRKRNCSTNCSGYRMSVAVLPRMQFSQDTEESPSHTAQREVEAWAHYLRNSKWSFSRCGNDIVLVLSVHDRKVHASAGHVAKKHLTSTCAESVIQDATSSLSRALYGDALRQMATDYHSVLRDDFKCVIEWNDVMSTGTMIGITFASVCIPLMLCVLAVFLGPCFRGRGFGGSGNARAFKKYRYHQPDYDFRDDSVGAATYM